MALRANASKQTRWLNLVQRWQRSTITVREFCRRQQISEPSFYAWRAVLRKRGLLDEARHVANASTPAFLKLTVESQPLPSSAVELVVGNRVLRVWSGFDAAMLLELVRLLEEPTC
jgi:transposase-like protein